MIGMTTSPRSQVPRTSADPSNTELAAKIAILLEAVERNRLGGIRLRGQDWFAWATCGGSSAVLLASERGIAEVVATSRGVHILTSAIEAGRLRAEELPDGLGVVSFEWAYPDEADALVRENAGALPIASDLPAAGEVALPGELVAEKRSLRPQEIARYRDLGAAAAAALTETLGRATPASTELEVAGMGAEALLRRGLEPALVLVAGSRRLDLYRHPRPTAEAVGDRVGVVFCGRRFGLYANLTRFAYFRTPSAKERDAANMVAQVEAAAFNASLPGATLGEVYAAIVDAYARLGHPGAERDHHQGGTTGYLSREVVATPGNRTAIVAPMAMAWNPSLPGTKIEDTVIRTDDGLEIVTVDPSWPTVQVDGRERPDLRTLG